ncbi:MAG TPA: fused MFS/spermidine synthase [Candidatus Saccharimonadales bacterium]
MRRIGKLETISFITGFSLLTFELAAARILAPSIGSSTYVWTSVIGVIIAALACGFWVGGKLADKRDHETDVVWLLGAAGFMVLTTLIFYPNVLETVVEISNDVRLQGVAAAFVLFAPTSFLIGVTSPYLAKLNVRSLKTTGQHIASLDALNSIGGIVGTFLTGFVLFGYVGSRQTFVIVATLLIGVSWLIRPRYRLAERLTFTTVCLVIIATSLLTPNKTIDIDTASAHYQVRNYTYNQRPIVGLTTDPMGIQSGVFADGSSEPVFWYTRELARLTLDRKPNKILIVGGGAFTLPQYLADQLPESQIDVVEIDPGLKQISEQYFHYKNPRNVRLVFNDARAYLNQANHTYDAIIIDAYGNSSIPFQLITREYVEALEKNLAQDGVVMANIIAGTYGPCLEVLEGINAAYQSRFPYAYYSKETGQPDSRTNLIVLYSHTPSITPGMTSLQLQKQRPYTDNYAPAERLYYACEHV